MSFLQHNSNPDALARTQTVLAPIDQLYQFCADPDRLAQALAPAIDLYRSTADVLQWKLMGEDDDSLKPLLEGHAQLVEAVPDELLRWEGDAFVLEARLEFSPAPADRGTEIRLTVKLDPNASVSGEAVDILGPNPAVALNKILRRIKSYVEAGEMPTLAYNADARHHDDSNREVHL